MVKLAQDTKYNCDFIAAKYSTHLTLGILEALDKIKMHQFIELSKEQYMNRNNFRGSWPAGYALLEFFELVFSLNKQFELGLEYNPNSVVIQNGSLGNARLGLESEFVKGFLSIG